MSAARHWSPPAFLLPSWSEAQLQRALGLQLRRDGSSGQRLHDNSLANRAYSRSFLSSSSLPASTSSFSSFTLAKTQTRANSSSSSSSTRSPRARSRERQAATAQRQLFSSTTRTNTTGSRKAQQQQQRQTYKGGWGSESSSRTKAQLSPISKTRVRQETTSSSSNRHKISEKQGLKLRFFIKKDASDADWNANGSATGTSPQKEVARVLALNNRRMGNAERTSGNEGSQTEYASVTSNKKSQSRQMDQLEGERSGNGDSLGSKTRTHSRTEKDAKANSSQGTRIKQSEARADSKAYVTLEQAVMRSSGASREHEVNPLFVSRTSTSRHMPTETESELEHDSDLLLESEPEPEMTLLEELFPELAALQASKTSKASKASSQKPTRREVPRLRIADINFSTSTDPEEDDLPSMMQQTVMARATKTNKATKEDDFEDNEVAVLVFRTWDTTLSEFDFERIVPRGRHIEEWRGLGSFLQVIPVRKANSLAPVGHYLLLFRNSSYRAAYRRNAERLAALSASYIPGSVEPLPGSSVQDGKVVEGEQDNVIIGDDDASALLEEFALVPRPQTRNATATSMFFRESSVRSSRALMRLVEHRGYEKLAGRAGRTVLFWVDGYAPLAGEIRRMVRADGRERGIAWTAARRLERLDVARLVTAGDEDEFGHDEEVAADGDLDESSGGKKVYSRWILEFDDETEARRFVRTWHLRDWPVTLEQRGFQGEPEALVHAEILW